MRFSIDGKIRTYILSAVIAIFLIILPIIGLIDSMEYYDDSLIFLTSYIPVFLPIIAGVTILLFYRENIQMMAGIFAISLSLMYFFYGYILSGNETVQTLIFSLLFIIAAIVLFFSSVSYLRGTSVNMHLITYPVLVFLAVDLVLILTAVDIIKEQPLDYFYYLLSGQPWIVMAILLVILIRANDVRERTTARLIRRKVADLMIKTYADDRMGYPEDRLSNLKKCIEKKRPEAFVPVDLNTSRNNNMRLSLQQGVSPEDIVVCIRSTDNESMAGGCRFKLTWADFPENKCESFRLYGENGMFIQLNVREPKVSRLSRFRFWDKYTETELYDITDDEL